MFHRQALLQALATSKSLPQITQIHQQLITNALSSDTFLATKLLQLYADSDDINSALHLFDQLPHPTTVFSWTPILAFHSRSGDHRRCLISYVHMRSHAVPPDGYVFPVVLRSSSSSPSSLHADVIKFGADDNLHVRNALIDAYSKCGNTVSARRVFDGTHGQDLISWNSMISGYVGVGSIDSAVEMLRRMQSEGCDPDLVTRNIIMDGYCRAGRCDEAVQIFDKILDPNVVSWTTLILGYSKCGNHEAALGIFRRMVFGGNVPPDHDTLSCVLASCRHVAALSYGREIHGYGLKTTKPDTFYCSAGAALVAMYASCNRILAAKRVFSMMDQTDVVTWNAAILGFVHSGKFGEALEYFSRMNSRRIRSDQITIATVLPACDLNPGKQIHAHVIRHYYESATPAWNALISMYSKSGCISTARSVFSIMETRDVVTWNTMIGAYGLHGLGEPAVELVWEMNRTGVRPNAVTFTCALAACSHSGLVDEGLELFESSGRDHGLVPTREQRSCIVDLLGRAGRFEEAVGFIRKMGVGPDGSVWGALLASCRAHQNVEFGELAFEELVVLEPENPGNYVTMASIYAREGRWGDAKRVRRLMERRGLVKPSGCSWIEVAEK